MAVDAKEEVGVEVDVEDKNENLFLNLEINEKMGADGMFCTKLYGLISVLNNNFGDDWCITGSGAIYIYLSILEEREQLYLMDVEPNDIDIFVKGNRVNTDVRFIGDYKRESDLQLRSSTYSRKDGFSLRVTFTSSVSMLEFDFFENRI